LKRLCSSSLATCRLVVFLAVFTAPFGLFSQRVVSLAPGLTEIVCALDRGGALVGVTKFCDYPQAVRKIAKVGGLLDFNVEALIALAPDVVVAYPEHAARLRLLPKRVRLITVAHRNLLDLRRAIRTIGMALGSERQAEHLLQTIDLQLRDVSRRVAGKRKVSALLIAGRSAGELKNMFIIGNGDFLNELLVIAGGVNAYVGNVAYPSISLEAAIFLDPEFIIEISAFQEGIAEERILRLWQSSGMVQAGGRGQVRVVKDSSWLRPGPRVGLVAEALAAMLHPAAGPAGGNS
jgi:iron complex transport system substrate-binding protein